ncbi:MAG: hypothetical protein ACRDO0_10415, partial [Nocardioidaceae bacterium]
MSKRTSPPFRADHVGSLLRPQRLTAARDAHRAGELDADRLREIEDECIRDVVAMQEDVGLQTATDGEFRRTAWHMDFIYQLGGIRPTDEKIQVHFENEEGELDFESAALRVHDRVNLETPIFGDAFSFVRDTAKSATAKLTIPSPSMVHYRGGAAAIDPAVYPDNDQFWSDLTSAYAKQVKMVHGLGCRYLQFDDTSLAYLNDPNQRKMMSERGEDAEHLHESYIRHINEALAGKPDDITITTHM